MRKLALLLALLAFATPTAALAAAPVHPLATPAIVHAKHPKKHAKKHTKKQAKHHQKKHHKKKS